MRKPPQSSWLQPSLLRDFFLLTVAIVIILICLSAWIAWLTHETQHKRVLNVLEAESTRIDRYMNEQLKESSFLLSAIGSEIVWHKASNLPQVARLLKSFDTNARLYTVWTWIDDKDMAVISSHKGILSEKVDVSDRSYLTLAKDNPGEVIVGPAIEGRVSNRWVIPMALSITDELGQYVGTLVASVDINTLASQIRWLIEDRGVYFAIYDTAHVLLTEVPASLKHLQAKQVHTFISELTDDKKSYGMLSNARFLDENTNYLFYRHSLDYPYTIFVSYNRKLAYDAVQNLLWPRLMQVIAAALFLILFLWIIRNRIIKPIVRLSDVAHEISSGNPYAPVIINGPQEIQMLAFELGKIEGYLRERKLVETEIRNKLALSHQELNSLKMHYYERVALFSGLLSESKSNLHALSGFSQIIKDQLYGAIENKKYRQYATDIYVSANKIESLLKDMLALTSVEFFDLALREEKLALREIITRLKQEMADMQPSVQLHTEKDDVLLKNAYLHVDGVYFSRALLSAIMVIYYMTESSVTHLSFHNIVQTDDKQNSIKTYIGVIGDVFSEAFVMEDLLQYAPLTAQEFIKRVGDENIYANLHANLASTLFSKMGITFSLIKIADEEERLVFYLPSSLFISE